MCSSQHHEEFTTITHVLQIRTGVRKRLNNITQTVHFTIQIQEALTEITWVIWLVFWHRMCGSLDSSKLSEIEFFYKILLRDIKEDLNKWRDIYWWRKIFNTVKMSNSLQTDLYIQCNLNQNLGRLFFVESDRGIKLEAYCNWLQDLL